MKQFQEQIGIQNLSLHKLRKLLKFFFYTIHYSSDVMNYTAAFVLI